MSEESIKKIEDIISKRLQDQTGFEQLFTVRRIDHATIDYSTSTDLVSSEENTNIDAVESLTILAKSESTFIEIKFEKNQKTELDIRSEDRDLALLLSADLKEYLKSEVNIKRMAIINRLINDRLVYPFLVVIPMFTLFIVQLQIPRFNIDLSKASTSEKIDYLVMVTRSRAHLDQSPFYILGMLFFLILIVFTLSSSAIFPTNTFYWGKQISKYDINRSLRSKIFWGVIVAIFVGIIVTISTKRL